MKPMKGTASRGNDPSEEAQARDRLREPKTIAENLMIVDMVRNDLGRIAKNGSVRADTLMETEIHGEILQVTSTIVAETDISNGSLLRAVFPPASVTGAPKVMSCQMISELENSGRGVYCGAVGYWAPGNVARLNVAIRTAVVKPLGDQYQVVYGAGGGIVWDSEVNDEYSESRLKLDPILRAASQWRLIEAFNVSATEAQIKAHLARLNSAAEKTGVRFDPAMCLQAVLAEIGSNLSQKQKVRISLALDGRFEVRIGSSLLDALHLRAHLASEPSRSDDPNYLIKTNSKAHYLAQKKLFRSFDDVLFYNERDELTEFASGNLVLRIGSELITPRSEAGLLQGLTVRNLMKESIVREASIPKSLLNSGDDVFVTNAVIGMRRIEVDLSSEASSMLQASRNPKGCGTSSGDRPPSGPEA
jgi:para-aminobenzoate synthetase/4-amino-4-deoxychorismate lyase